MLAGLARQSHEAGAASYGKIGETFRGNQPQRVRHRIHTVLPRQFDRSLPQRLRQPAASGFCAMAFLYSLIAAGANPRCRSISASSWNVR